ncbi:MAG: phosphatidate cytidylyltransferase [Bacteroidales bacterium]
MNNFLTRTITGALFVFVVVGSALWNYWAFASVIGLFMILGLWEFYDIINRKGICSDRIAGTIIGLAIFIITVLHNSDIINIKTTNILYFSLFSASILVFFAELYGRSKYPFRNIANTFLGIIYIAIPFSLLISLTCFSEEDTENPAFPIFYFFILWTYDTFAYLIGMKFGKHKLFERISPQKSWEGVIGGLLFAFILATVFSEYYFFLSWLQWLILALIIVIFGTFGDLTESMLKRSMDCKDSGTFFPGHGGILDRFDSVLLSVPFVFIYIEFLEHF